VIGLTIFLFTFLWYAGGSCIATGRVNCISLGDRLTLF
jgi:hypothetical protein